MGFQWGSAKVDHQGVQSRGPIRASQISFPQGVSPRGGPSMGSTKWVPRWEVPKGGTRIRGPPSGVRKGGSRRGSSKGVPNVGHKGVQHGGPQEGSAKGGLLWVYPKGVSQGGPQEGLPMRVHKWWSPRVVT